MRPDIPWNVAGIPPEAREAARAAARREGLSVGEWMTRRILRSFSDAPEETVRESWSGNGSAYAPEPRAVQARRDTEDMLARVAKSESESNDVYRRIEDQLRSVARRLESAERNQAENNRAMSKAAAEINVAAREQAVAFDQLGGSVTSLADRLDRVERSSTTDGTRDAIKGLHQGLSRLADQIAATANHSATQIGTLASNLEALAGRLAQARQESEQTAQALGQRIAETDHQIAMIDQRVSTVSAIDDRLKSVERAAQATNDVLNHAVQSIEARKDEEAAALRRDSETASAIARLEDNLSRLEARGPDPSIDRRLSSIERSLGDIVGRFENPPRNDAVEDSIKKLAQRIDAAEARAREPAAPPPAPAEKPNPFAPMDTVPAFAPPLAAQPSFAPPPVQPSFEPPPFAEPHGFETGHDPFAAVAAEPPPFETSATAFGATADAAFGTGTFGAADPFAPPADHGQPENYLSAARRSARAAAAQADADRGSRTGRFSWGAAEAAPAPAKTGSRKTLTWVLLIALLAVAAIVAGAVLSRKLSTNSSHTVSMLFPKGDSDTPIRAARDADATPAPATPNKSDVKPLAPPQTVKPARVHSVPAETAPAAVPPAKATTPAVTPPAATSPAAATTPPKPAAALTPVDKLTQLATAGNAKAELVVGLKYLDGDGVAVNETQAATWLERAAEQGQPVAQYRLGTLYERGRGVPADAAKAVHWYQLAAQAGNRKAMHNLAVAYASGTGTTKNLAEAARWFSKAASLGLADSQFNLAVLYERGMGVPQSLLDAYKWYAIAAAAGDTESKSRIDALSTQISADDRAAAQRAAESFHAQPIDAKANVAPQLGDIAG